MSPVLALRDGVDGFLGLAGKAIEGRREPLFLGKLRRDALAAFARLGFPATANEDWRYTNLAPLSRIGFTSAPPPGPHERFTASVLDHRVEHLGFSAKAPNQLVFLNGHLLAEWSSQEETPAGVALESMSTALASWPERVALHLGRHARFEEHAFTALNTALFSDGAVVLVPKGVSVETPLFVHHVSAAQPPALPQPPTVSCPRTLIVLEEGASATVVETFAGFEGTFLTNAVSEAALGPGSSLTHVRLQDEGTGTFHVSRLFLDQAAHAQSTAHLFSFGALLARNETVALLGGEGAGTSLNGLFCAGGGQHVDNHTLIHHVAPRGSSRELYKGILGGRARGVFDGKIVVGTGAPRTDAHQSNRNVILSAEALVDSKPQLEIYNNDVRCTHGSTTGRLDEDALFYLRSRGLGAEEARALLTFAFGSELVEKISDPVLRTRLADRLRGWLPSQERLRS